VDQELEQNEGPRPLRIFELGEADLRSLALPGSSAPPATIRLRQVHHAVARYLVAGMRPVEVSELIGVSQTTISILQQSPAFQELLEHYREKADSVAFDFQEKIRLLGADTISRLHEMVVENEGLEPEFLRKLTVDLADRLGYAPVKRVEKRIFTTTISVEDLQAIKAKYRQEALPLDAAPATVRPEGVEAGEGSAADQGSGVGTPIVYLPARLSDAPRSAGEGEGV
jgi:hypothetical protein